jgi:hypothetical protein
MLEVQRKLELFTTPFRLLMKLPAPPKASQDRSFFVETPQDKTIRQAHTNERS